jgi:FkbM family methyltransferase
MARFVRPEYIYQPAKLIRRLFSKGLAQGGEEIVELPWKMSMEVDSSEIVGFGIAHTGIFEIPVVEAIFRLVDPSETVLDVGANIGYMTAAALSAGAGKVILFEPHPALFARLSRNVSRWNKEPRYAGRVNARNEAIDSQRGRATLFIPKRDFAGNQGIATLEMNCDTAAFDKVEVAATTLDSVIDRDCGPVGLLKIDIEGHEFAALKGASDSLRNRKIRDVIYECFEGADSPVSQLLKSFGYTIFGLRSSLTGPVLLEGMKAGRVGMGDHNLVATLDPDRARKRMSQRGYKCLSRKARQSDL